MVGSVVALLRRMTWARKLESEQLIYNYLQALLASLEEAEEVVADEGN